jgi:CheY-like chemotaxis protein
MGDLSDPHSGLILCLDDDLNGLAARKAVLASAGFDVVTVSEVTEAIELLTSRTVALIISDHFLRSATGTEVSKTFKAIRPEFPILILSGSMLRNC